jgi:hypothetical protein
VILRWIVEGEKKSNNVINQYRSLHILAIKYYQKLPEALETVCWLIVVHEL